MLLDASFATTATMETVISHLISLDVAGMMFPLPFTSNCLCYHPQPATDSSSANCQEGGTGPDREERALQNSLALANVS